MFRPPPSNGGTNKSRIESISVPNKQHNNSNNNTNSNETTTTAQTSTSSPTIREIRSRTTSNSSNTNSRHLLNNRRQAMSMEKLNGSSSSVASTVLSSSNDREKSSSSGSSTSINSSPVRGGGGLNRTASRVSRFRSAKAVFERLSNNNNSNNKLDNNNKPLAPEKPRGTVASRYAAAAAARAMTHSSNTTTSPRSRLPTGSLVRSQDSGKSASNIEIHRSFPSNSSKSDASQPKPQPRVILNRSTTTGTTNSSSSPSSSEVKNRLPMNSNSSAKSSIQAKLPPKDLIDKIVLEIALDAKQDPDPNCTIQDLSNCDISGIPETLDFDRCFQDVEMMTEEEARKLLSKKPDHSSPSPDTISISVVNEVVSDKESLMDDSNSENIPPSETVVSEVAKTITLIESKNTLLQQSISESSAANFVNKSKVRFSEEPAKIFNTHAVEDYDRRNDDIDPVAASAEYEIEKSKEREGLKDSDDEDFEDSESTNDHFNQTKNGSVLSGAPPPHTLRDVDPHNVPHDSLELNSGQQNLKDEEEQLRRKEYIESLEREVGLKRILEQNLRDLQSQYYEAVKELDDYKGATEIKLSDLEQNLGDLTSKFESSQNELTDAREQSLQFEKQLNEIKESSQILEKKYHRAKKIIKDMQTREQSFNRREQLYQQKLDEIEYELGMLIESVDRTIYEDGLKFYSLIDSASNQRPYQAQLDVFGLIKQMLNNFNSNQNTQNPQIKQRVVSILEQQLANLMVLTKGSTSVVSSVPHDPLLATVKTINSISDNAQSVDSNKHSQSYQLASHRLSQPNLPHPIGVSGQPTKLFHGITPVPIPVAMNEPSPPQSVNSYPSTNSLNSLNNNNITSINNNNNNHNSTGNNGKMIAKLREQPSISDLHLNMTSVVPSTTNDTKFRPALDIQVPYQTNEWHDKPVSEWTTTQVSTWLLALGLDQYISKFEDRNVNGQSLINLDSTVLKGLGVLNSNDRNLLKKKIRELRIEMEKERKLMEKKMKENLKDKSKNKQINGNSRIENKTDQVQPNKPSWKRSLLS